MRDRWGRTLAPAGALLALALVLPGCFSQILPAGPATRLEFACAVLDPGVADQVVIESWTERDVDLATRPALAALAAELGGIGDRGSGVVLRVEDGRVAPPRGGWDDASLRAWLEDRPFRASADPRLHVLWAATLGGPSSAVVDPGLVAVAQDAVRAGAGRLGVGEAEVARAVLLHAAGHALGAVNQGVPVQDPDLQEREGPPGHDPDPASVLHAGWEDPAAMAWAPNATYDAYPARLHADWEAAVAPGGVCDQ